MATLQQQIANKFIVRLADANALDETALEQLRAYLADGKKVRPDDLVKIFTSPTSGDVK
jgi:hypothetical protein